MKLRAGFVSNSSSSSFLCMGKWLDENLPYEEIRKLRDKGLRYYDSSEDGPCVGVGIDIKDDETWGQYKERVATKMTLLGLPTEAKDVNLCSGEYMC